MADLFLDALTRRTNLAKGFPLGSGQTLKADKKGQPIDLYKVSDPVTKAIGRLQTTAEMDAARQADRLEVEKSEGLTRNMSRTTNQITQAKKE